MWTTPFDWTTNDKVTATRLNVYFRDNLNFLHDPPFCLAFNPQGTGIPENTVVPLEFPTVIHDNDEMYGSTLATTITPGSCFTAKTKGEYVHALNAVINNGLNGTRLVSIRVTAHPDNWNASYVSWAQAAGGNESGAIVNPTPNHAICARTIQRCFQGEVIVNTGYAVEPGQATIQFEGWGSAAHRSSHWIGSGGL